PHEQGKDNNDVSWRNTKTTLAKYEYRGQCAEGEEFKQSANKNRQEVHYGIRTFKPAHNGIDARTSRSLTCRRLDDFDARNPLAEDRLQFRIQRSDRLPDRKAFSVEW